MKEFTFNGDWETTLEFEHFKEYYATKYTNEGPKLTLFKNDPIDIEFLDEYGDMNPDIGLSQLNTINYLLNPEHQKEIIISIIEYLNEVVYPFYNTEEILPKNEYPKAYPEVKTLEDFKKYFKLSEVSINTLSKGDFSYYCLYFGVSLLDEGHGLSIEMHKNRCIDHGSDDGIFGDKLAVELGFDKQEKIDLFHKITDEEEAILYKPNGKYGKLKPWQINANNRFEYNAYRTERDDLLIEYINIGVEDIKRFKYLYMKAQEDGRAKLIEFFSKIEELN